MQIRYFYHNQLINEYYLALSPLLFLLALGKLLGLLPSLGLLFLGVDGLLQEHVPGVAARRLLVVAF